MKYPEPVGPRSQSAVLAWLFSSLGAAYSIIDQYEQDDAAREHERLREVFMNPKPMPKPDDESASGV